MLAVAGIITGLLGRLALGRPLRFDGIRIRGETLLLVALVLSALLPIVASTLAIGRSALLVIWLTLMLTITGLCLVNTVHMPGFALLAAGAGLNTLVVALNGGMPVAANSISAAGGTGAAIRALAPNLFHVLLSSRTLLPILSDVLPLRAPAPIQSVLSGGDVLMAVGIVVVVVSAETAAAGESTARVAGSPRLKG